MNPSLSLHRQRVTRLVQAYRQAPWRTQRQWIVVFLLATIAIGMVAGLYLNVTARAALAGREVQVLEEAITQNQLTNADLQTAIASQLSTENMAKRAEALGYQWATPDQVEYMTVKGYYPPQPVVMQQDMSDSTEASVIDPLYTQSLLQWIGQEIGVAAIP